MTRKFPVLATVLLLASGLAVAEPVNAAAPGTGLATVAVANAGANAGASGAAALFQVEIRSQANAPAARTRAEVRAEAIEAVRNHRSTFARDLDFLKN